MKWFKSFIFLFATIISTQVFAVKSNPEIEDLRKRIERLEDYKGNIETKFDAKAENLKKYLDDEVKRELTKIEEAKKTLDLLLFFGIPGTIISLLVVFIAASIHAKKLVTNRIDSVIEHKREAIISLVETETFDNKLRNQKRLLIISGSEDSNEKVLKFLRKLKFKKVTGRVITDLGNLPEHDLMVFNTPDGLVDQPIIDELMNRYQDEDDCFVAYTNTNLRRDARLNFSNSQFTLYHSILSTLKYAEIAKPIEEN